MYDSAFTPIGPTVLVDANVMRQVAPITIPTQQTTYRVLNKGSSIGYIGWVVSNQAGNAAPALITVAAPAVGVPLANVVGLQGNATEVFTFPQNAWFVASSGATFEMTAGEGY